MREEVIGDCRLILGDCREVLPTLDGIDSIVTDPPYGMAFQSNYRATKHSAIANDRTTELFTWACALQPRHSSYVFGRWDNLWQAPKPTSLITWVKNNWSMGDLNHEHARQTEVVLFYRGSEHFFPSGRPQDVVRCARTGNEYHPSEKPVPLMEVIVGWTSGVVFDPFAGSGSTLVACTRMGRAAVGCEIDPAHYETSLRRIEAAHREPRLFADPAPKPTQAALI